VTHVDPPSSRWFSNLLSTLFGRSSICGSWTTERREMTPTALITSIGMAEQVGLTLNFKKCEVAVLGAEQEEADAIYRKFNEVAPGIARICEDEATLLGSPLTGGAIEGVLGSKTAKLADTAERLAGLTAHSAFFLLRASVSLPRLIYFLRCAPCWQRTGHLLEYDKTLRVALERILSCAFSDRGWLQTSLPVRMGAWGSGTLWMRRFRVISRRSTVCCPL